MIRETIVTYCIGDESKRRRAFPGSWFYRYPAPTPVGVPRVGDHVRRGEYLYLVRAVIWTETNSGTAMLIEVHLKET